MRWMQVALILVLFAGLLGYLDADPLGCSALQQSVCKDKCIPVSWLCNGERDCPDGTDEQCDLPCLGDINAWQCDNGKCISKSWKCDGINDCLDGSDELDCACTGNKIQCDNSSECIDAWEVCDGYNDCENGSDEQNCKRENCMEHQVQCKNKVCIMESWQCDGINSCGDGSDEDSCELCDAGFYKCGDGKCINGSKVCNHEIDCPDGSDESESCGRRCSDKNGGCSQKCEEAEWGVSCSCHEGWKLEPDRHSCADVNECSLDYSPCHQLCNNSNGSFACGCTKGFELKQGTVCEVIGNATVILLAKRGEVGIVDARTGDYQHLFSVHGQPSTVAYFLSSESYFWIDEDQTLQSFVIGGKNSTSLYPEVGNINSLSVDWYTGQIYWASRVNKTISVGLTDGRGYVHILEKNIVPDQLLVFPQKRYMYWVNYGKNGKTTLEMAGMDGSDRHVISFLPMEQPTGLTLDYIASRLYWISEYKESIETIKTDGTGRFTFPDILHKDQNVLGMSIFEGWFFLADEKHLFSLSRNNPLERRLLLNSSNISAFTILHELQQPTEERSPCSLGTCSHICLLSPVLAKSYKCACPAGLFLLPSGKCENLTIVYGNGDGIVLLELGFQGVFSKRMVRQAPKINLMDVDWKRDLVYWTDDHGLLFKSSGLHENPTIIHTGGAVCTVKIDIPTGNLYWLPCEKNRVYLTKHSGFGTKMIYRSMNSIQHLLLDWEKALIYIVEEDNLIRQMNLIGGEVENVLNGTGFTHMSLDIKSHSIVWTSPDDGLYSFGLVRDRLFHLKDNFTSALMDSFEPYLISYNDPVIEIWNRKTSTIVSNINEVNVTKLVITSSHVKGSHSACSLDNGGCMSEEICVPGSKEVIHCLCPDDRVSCNDGGKTSPENPSISESLFCPRAFVPCRDGKECVSSDFICDGEKDCLDGSDEYNCTNYCSNADIFQCLTGTKCIEDRYRCDGVSQCPDGSDERDCWSPSENCAFRCDRNSRCIPQSSVCDGKPDCFDETDEQGCGPKMCSSGKFQCTNGQCIPYSMHCDGDNDCDDHTDEVNCTISKPVHCQNGDFRCQSGECIFKEWKCDDAKDCKDGSDEKDCKPETLSCEKTQWACASVDQCIPSFWKCDGNEDCRDGSDEVECDAKCSNNLYQCANHNCTALSLVCDGKPDCSDGSDEGGKCQVPCEDGCTHACYMSPLGPRCMCDKGFKLSGSKSICMDINECKELDPSPCSQSCINLNGTFNCTCHPGYALQLDGLQCKVTGTEPILLVAIQFDLLLYKLKSLDEEVLMSTDKSSMIFSVDYDIMEQKIFWMDLNAESIKWITMGTKAKGTLVKGVKSDCIAVDWVGRNLYWTDGIASQILATSLNASWNGFPEYTVILDEEIDQPRSLVLQPLNGLMYWCEIGLQPQIERAGMDGSHRRVLIAEQLGWPTGLALDLLSWRIYWSDEKFHSIGSASLDGTDIKVIQLKTIQSPFALTVFEDEIYWSEIKARTVQKISKRTGKNHAVLIKRRGQPYGLKVIHEVLQPTTDNPCHKLACSHVCLIGPGLNASCRCPTGLVLSSNLHDCVPLKDLPFLLIALSSSVNQVDLHKLDLVGQKAPTMHQIASLNNINHITSIDYIIQDRFLVFAVKDGGYIASTKAKDSYSKDWKKVVFVDDLVICIAVDWVTGNIFWIDKSKPSIQVATPNGMFKAVVLEEDLYKPSCLALYPSSGLMCYFDAGLENKKNSVKLECANMDGTNRRIIWRKSKAVVGLTFADSGTRLYWADRGYGTVESIKVDGSSYKLVRSGLRTMNLFTAGDGLLFWTTFDNGTGRVWFSKISTNDHKYFEMNQKVVDIKVYSRPVQQAISGCSQNNGGCSQICLPNHKGRTCRCSTTHQLVNATLCLEEPKCSNGYLLCKDGTKCIPNRKICDDYMDCLDGSDERGCVYIGDNRGVKPVSPTKSKMPIKAMGHPRLHEGNVEISFNTKPPILEINPLSEDLEEDNSLANEDFGREMESRPCTSETCNMRGECIVDDGVVKCKCFSGYSGEFCEEGVKALAVPLTVGTVAVLLVFAVVAGIFVFVTRRKALQRTSSCASSRTLTRQNAKDMEPLEVQNKESSETFLNDAFDAGGITSEQDHV